MKVLDAIAQINKSGSKLSADNILLLCFGTDQDKESMKDLPDEIVKELKTKLKFKSNVDNTLVGVEVFAVGKWNGETFNLKDLEGIAKAFTDLIEVNKVYLKIGHNDEQVMTDGMPAIGWVSKVYVANEKLLADFTDVPDIIQEAIESKAYRSVSIELLGGVSYKGDSFKWVMSAVALLGADTPAVNTLADLNNFLPNKVKLNHARQKSFSSNQNTKEGTIMPMTAEEQARYDKAIADVNALSTKFNASEAEKLKFTAENDALKKSAADSIEADKKAKVEFSRKTVTEMLEKAVTDKKIAPANRDLFHKTLNTASDEVVITIDTKDVEALIKSVNFSEESGGGHNKGDAEGDANSKLVAQANDIRLKAGVTNMSFSQAVNHAITMNPELGREYVDSNGEVKQ